MRIDQEITLVCTDNGKKVQAHILSFNYRKFIDVAINTVRVKLVFKKNAYAGSLGGYEFVIKEDQL